jgi:pimeloyl-ACP methyl ester carboxylesterase
MHDDGGALCVGVCQHAACLRAVTSRQDGEPLSRVAGRCSNGVASVFQSSFAGGQLKYGTFVKHGRKRAPGAPLAVRSCTTAPGDAGLQGEGNMLDTPSEIVRAAQLQQHVAKVFAHRTTHAAQQFVERTGRALAEGLSSPMQAWLPWQLTMSWHEYAVDFCQRSVLMLDTLRLRGNQFLEHTLAGNPPVLHFEYQTVLDARTFPRPANYALVRITAPTGVTTDAKKRPYMMIDPRAGHGPGIGGFKDDSQVGVALRAGHPVYFVIFFPEPQPGQTMDDVCVAEQAFVRHVSELHPESEKPVVVGNCQGGWAAMMVAASSPEDTGPLVISGAPMSYWSGAWTEGEGNNPMRYAGGMLGGTWLASFTADMGAGLFDGAHLVQNFEALNPANTHWDKYYNVFSKIDTEPPRFLEFERWWGGYYLMNREEIEWITQNLFVGNDLWKGGVRISREALDLRRVRSPIIMFASLGDNITPPQQAFNWLTDVYASTEELKANGQVIIGLVSQSAGHLALFVSGKVAKREHAQIVTVLDSIEALPPGLYAMRINDSKRSDGTTEYEVDFQEHRVEDLAARLNRFERVDERPFEAVKLVSEFNQRAYELFAQPLVTAAANPLGAWIGRMFHPLRVQHWAWSSLNPCLWWVEAAAQGAKAHRQQLDASHPLRKAEAAFSELVSGTLELRGHVKDAATEALFFEIYGNLARAAGTEAHADALATPVLSPESSPVVQEALAAVEQGGYAAALARTGELFGRAGAPIPLARIERRSAMIKEYADLLPDLPLRDWKVLRGQQYNIVRYEPERAMTTLPRLLADPADRERFLQVLERVASDREFVAEPTLEQLEVVKRIRKLLRGKESQPHRPVATA